jgi:hypothetical protein
MIPLLLQSCESLVQANGTIVGSEIADKTREAFPTLLSCITADPTRPYLASLDGRLAISHAEAHDFIRDFGSTLHACGVGRGQRVALILPNGPELALAILAVSNWTGCVPLSATGAVSELEADLARCGPDLIIGPYSAGPLPKAAALPSGLQPVAPAVSELSSGAHVLLGDNGRDWTVHEHVMHVAKKMNIPFVGLVPDPCRAGPFKLWWPIGRKTKSALIYEELPAVPENVPEYEHSVDPAMNTEKVRCCFAWIFSIYDNLHVADNSISRGPTVFLLE